MFYTTRIQTRLSHSSLAMLAASESETQSQTLKSTPSIASESALGMSGLVKSCDRDEGCFLLTQTGCRNRNNWTIDLWRILPIRQSPYDIGSSDNPGRWCRCTYIRPLLPPTRPSNKTPAHVWLCLRDYPQERNDSQTRQCVQEEPESQKGRCREHWPALKSSHSPTMDLTSIVSAQSYAPEPEAIFVVLAG